MLTKPVGMAWRLGAWLGAAGTIGPLALGASPWGCWALACWGWVRARAAQPRATTSQDKGRRQRGAGANTAFNPGAIAAMAPNLGVSPGAPQLGQGAIAGVEPLLQAPEAQVHGG